MHIEDISYPEYRRLFNGLMSDTPLGQVISIRSEKDQNTIKNFGINEKKIRSDWNRYRLKQKNGLSIEEKQKQVLAFQKAMKEAFFRKGRL